MEDREKYWPNHDLCPGCQEIYKLKIKQYCSKCEEELDDITKDAIERGIELQIEEEVKIND